jgi:superfamily II DNA or RNA helicase
MELIELRDYQINAKNAALASLQACGGYGLFLEQRTGKTLTALWTMKEAGVKKLLVICPKRALPVWHAEIKRVPEFKPQLEVLNFEQVWRQEDRLLKAKFDGMIVDESHRIKERGSKQSKSCWKLAKVIPHRLVLTGTPQGNGAEDLYSQFKVINPKLWPTWGEFERRYLVMESLDLPGRPMFKRITGYQHMDEIEAALLKYSYRITRAEVEKPKPIRLRKYKVQLTDSSRKHYKELEKKLITLVNNREVTTPMVLTQGLRLHQLCGGWLTSDDGVVHRVGTEKLEALQGILTQGPNKSWVVVARYLKEIDSIKELGISLGMSTQEISGRQQYDPILRPQLTVLQPQSGLAIDLSYASDLIIFSQDYSYLNHAQFKDRIVKLGGVAPTYHYLLVENSMDEVIYQTVVEKKKLSDQLMSIYKSSCID